MKRAQEPGAGIPAGGGTVYLTTADEKGMMLSFIQSNYMGFGSGVVVPGTGISMQNRGARLHARSAGTRTRSARASARSTRSSRASSRATAQPVMSFGVMGGNMQSQGHVQMVTRLVDYNQNPQACSRRAALDREHRLLA